MLNRLPWESAQIQCTHFYFRFWTEGKTDLWNSWWQNSIWLRTSFKIQKRDVFMRLWERRRLRDASKDFLRKKGKTTFYGTGWAMVGNSCHLKQGSAWRMLRQAPKWGLIPLSPHQPGWAAKGTPSQRMRLCGGSMASTGQWQKRVHYLQSHQRMSLPKTVLAADVHVRWWSAVQTLSNPRRAWKRQCNRVRGCNHNNKLAATHVKEHYWKLAAETPTVKVCIIFYTRWESISLWTKLIVYLVNYWSN